MIDINNFKIPFENNSFDLVISTSVFEHVFNKEEAFREIKRVLKKDGLAIHNFPSKYYLPIDHNPIHFCMIIFSSKMQWV